MARPYLLCMMLMMQVKRPGAIATRAVDPAMGLTAERWPGETHATPPAGPCVEVHLDVLDKIRFGAVTR